MLIQKVRKHFEANLTETPLIIAQRVVTPSELSGSNLIVRFDEAVDRLLLEVYSKNGLAGKTALTNQDMAKNAHDKKEIAPILSAGEIELDSKITLLGSGCSLEDVINKMAEAPFGWRDLNTINTLLGLAQKGKRRFEYKNERMESYAIFAEKASNSRERSAISVLSEQNISAQEVKAFIELVNNTIFSETILPLQVVDAKAVVLDFKQKITSTIQILSKNADDFEGQPFNVHIKKFKKALESLVAEREPSVLFQKTTEQKLTLAEQRDLIVQLNDFLETRTPQYNAFRTFVKTHKDNFTALDDSARLNAQKLVDYIKTDDTPYAQFPTMLKIYRSLENDLKDLVTNLKERTKVAYQTAFAELEGVKKDLKISENDVLPDMGDALKNIERSNNITELQLKLRQVSDFKTDGLRDLYDFQQRAQRKEHELSTAAEPSTPPLWKP